MAVTLKRLYFMERQKLPKDGGILDCDLLAVLSGDPKKKISTYFKKVEEYEAKPYDLEEAWENPPLYRRGNKDECRDTLQKKLITELKKSGSLRLEKAAQAGEDTTNEFIAYTMAVFEDMKLERIDYFDKENLPPYKGEGLYRILSLLTKKQLQPLGLTKRNTGEIEYLDPEPIAKKRGGQRDLDTYHYIYRLAKVYRTVFDKPPATTGEFSCFKKYVEACGNVFSIAFSLHTAESQIRAAAQYIPVKDAPPIRAIDADAFEY